jgi:hypothetical protein
MYVVLKCLNSKCKKNEIKKFYKIGHRAEYDGGWSCDCCNTTLKFVDVLK